jgi:ribosomal protein S18 acetylase RimI-like enzyme
MPDMTGSIAVRPAVAADAAEICRMVVELAVYEREPPERVLLTEDALRRDAFGPRPACEILVAERGGGRILGFTLFHANYSTWEGRVGIHIEELYVREEARGTGLGRRLMAAVAAIAEARGCPRVDLDVLHWNPAKRFYERLGMIHLDEWQHYRLEKDALRNLAAEGGKSR